MKPDSVAEELDDERDWPTVAQDRRVEGIFRTEGAIIIYFIRRLRFGGT